MYGGNADGIDYNYQQQQPQQPNTYQEPNPYQQQNPYQQPTLQQHNFNQPQSQQDPFVQPNPIQQQTTKKPRPFQQQETQDEEGTVFRPRPSFGGGLRPKEPLFTQQVQNEITQPIKPNSAKR